MRQILAAATGLVVLAASACSAPTPPRSAAPSATPTGPATLPAPTGAHLVGTTALYLKDASRPDPWNLDVDARELKVTLWYPTEQRGGQRAPYMTPKESELTLRRLGIGGVPNDTLSKTRTNTVKDAEPAGRNLPLVVISPGFTNPMITLTSLAEDLASRGYVVAGIDHTYESYATTFPGGRVAECLACDSDTDPGFGTGVVAGRAADVSFDGRRPRYHARLQRSARGARRRAHPLLRGSLPRPAPEVQAAAPPGQAVLALPRGRVLPRDLRPVLRPCEP
ncbi:hypothetical protein [Streptosporangium canum]|nr:hypothetical protein [Streptosporangium canum]